jgi:pimeloyl-ACP methyl ester carboxylesterase
VSADPADSSLVADGRATRILSAGQGQPLVWLHDTLGNRWSEAHSLLSQTLHVLAPSLPGFEDSTTLDGIDGPEDVVFWLHDLLDGAALDQPPVLLGCGLGGWMAAELAVRYPGLIRALVLVDAYGLRVPGALAEDEFALPPSQLRPLLFAQPDGSLAQDVLPDVEPAERLESTLHARVAAARLAWQFPYDRKLAGRLHRVRLPALVMWGACDRLVPLAHAEAFAKHLPSAELVVLPESGHYPYFEQPEPFAQAAARFVRNVP